MFVEYIDFKTLVFASAAIKSALRRYRNTFYFLGSAGNEPLLSIARDGPEEDFDYIKVDWKEGTFELLKKWDVSSDTTLVIVHRVSRVNKEMEKYLRE